MLRIVVILTSHNNLYKSHALLYIMNEGLQRLNEGLQNNYVAQRHQYMYSVILKENHINRIVLMVHTNTTLKKMTI